MITLVLAKCGCGVAPFDSRDQAARATQGGTRSMAVIEPCVGPLGWRPVNDIFNLSESYSCNRYTTSFYTVLTFSGIVRFK